MNSTSPSDNALAALLASARTHINNNALREAAQLLNQAQTISPQDPRILVLGGLLAEQAGNAPAALQSLERAALAAPQWWPGRMELALYLARTNQFRRAIAEADALIKLAPNEVQALFNAIEIAHRCQDYDRAVKWIAHGLRMLPGDALLLSLLAQDNERIGKIEESLQAWDELLAQDPQNPQAHFGRLTTLVRAGRAAQAQANASALLQQAPDDPIYQYYAKIANGQTPATQPAELQKLLFNPMAEQYDLRMVRTLGYQLPRQVAEQITEIFPDKKLNLLDLGCGTGLLGVYLGPIQGAMVGVDLSEAMIDQAARHNVYHRFHTVNILEALRDTPDALYDVIAALDVFPYIGDLAQAIANAQRILAPGGFFIFSTESADKDDAEAAANGYALKPAGRYTHHRAYLEKLLKQAGFAYVNLHEQTIRTEGGQPVKGFVITAQKLG